MIRWTGLTMLGLAMAVTLTAAQDDRKDEKINPKADDREKLQGKWVTIAMEKKGKRYVAPPDVSFVVFAGDRYSELGGKKGLDGTFRVDASKQPKTIDLMFEEITLRGIYELNDDLLRVCLSPDERPTEFKSKGGTLVTEYKRDRRAQKVEPLAKEGAQPNAENKVDDKTQELIERVKKNMAESEGRLDKKDPYDDTRQIQRDIIKDLDELIEKQNQNDQNNSGGGGGGGASSNDKSGGSSGKSGRRSKANQGGQANKGGAKGGQDQAKNDGKGGQDQDPKSGKGGQDQGKNGKDQAKNDGKGGQDQAKGDGKGGKNGKSGGGQGGNGTKDKNTIADLFTDIWGHLPQTKRMEMDAYSKERFMPKYDDLLRQYYRTIAEQGRKKTGD